MPLAERREQAIDLCAEVPRGALQADRDLLGRVLQNLLDNALRHSPAHSSVRLAACVNGEWVHITVCDEGPGIEAHLRDRVFDRHVRLEEDTDKARTGRGLGLTFCRLAVEAHGGTIWIEDNEPRGSRFCFRLPAAAEAESDSWPRGDLGPARAVSSTVKVDPSPAQSRLP